jgi:hypothetical protein
MAALAACSSSGPAAGPSPHVSGTGGAAVSPSATASPGVTPTAGTPTAGTTTAVTPTAGATLQASCPAAYLPPDPHRPRVTLRFTIGADHATVSGREQVVFTPDQAVSELVFRLWPNALDHHLGGALKVTAAQLNGHAVTARTASAGARAGTQGTLLSLPLGYVSPAGKAIVATLNFMLRLPRPFIDELGSDGHTAWWGTSSPLLAWVSGSGWVRTPGVDTLAELAVSEAAAMDVTVIAPKTDTVIANGVAAPAVAVSSTQRSWHFTNPVARDALVVVGRLAVVSQLVPTPAGNVLVRVAQAPGLDGSPRAVMQEVRSALPLLVKHYGPYPFQTLNVAVVPGLYGSGIEYPGMFLLGQDTDQSVTSHEAAHMWFYALVGDDQEQHPWLDEAFATAAEQLVDVELFNGTLALTQDARELLADRRPVDSPLSKFIGDVNAYGAIVYFKGAAALVSARLAAGAAKYDAAVRCYVNSHAWKIATPADFARALSGLPAALAPLRKAGAIR